MIGEEQITLLGLLYFVSSRTGPLSVLLRLLKSSSWVDFLSAWIPMVSAHLSHCLPCRNLAPWCSLMLLLPRHWADSIFLLDRKSSEKSHLKEITGTDPDSRHRFSK